MSSRSPAMSGFIGTPGTIKIVRRATSHTFTGEGRLSYPGVEAYALDYCGGLIKPQQQRPSPLTFRIRRGLSSPQVGSEDLVADSGRRHAAVKQRGPDVLHERRRTAGKDLDIVR